MDSIGITEDYFLDNFEPHHRIKLIGAFAQALRDGRFSGPAYETLAHGTINNTISSLVQTFRDNDREDPTRDRDGKVGRLLQQQLKAYKKKDPPERQQKALPCCVLVELARMDATEVQKATAELAIGVFFFAMRSCEYLKVPEAEKKQTDVLRLRNIKFYDDEGALVPHSSPNLANNARNVSITFERQKKDERMDNVTQMESGDALLCPKRGWAEIVQRIRKYPGATDDTPVSAVWRNGRIEHITSRAMTVALEAAVEAVGYDRLGIKKVRLAHIQSDQEQQWRCI
jgi:hypothetical protein